VAVQYQEAPELLTDHRGKHLESHVFEGFVFQREGSGVCHMVLAATETLHGQDQKLSLKFTIKG
jgi:hypothetical protein